MPTSSVVTLLWRSSIFSYLHHNSCNSEAPPGQQAERAELKKNHYTLPFVLVFLAVPKAKLTTDSLRCQHGFSTYQHQDFQSLQSSPWQGEWLRRRLPPKCWQCSFSSWVCNSRCTGRCWMLREHRWGGWPPWSAGRCLARHKMLQSIQRAGGCGRREGAALEGDDCLSPFALLPTPLES